MAYSRTLRKRTSKLRAAINEDRARRPQPIAQPTAPVDTKPIFGPEASVERSTLINRLITQIEDELSARQQQEENWARWLELYRPTERAANKAYPWPNASNIDINLAAIYVDTITARIMQGLFAVEPFWVCRAHAKRFESAAKPLENYLEWLRQHAWDEYRVVKPMVLEVCKLGTSVLMTGWSDLPTARMDERTGQLVRLPGRRTGPRAQWVRREDFLIPAGFTSINDSEKGIKAPWIACRQRFTLAQLQQQQDTGFFTDIEPLTVARGDERTRLDEVRNRDAMNPTTGPSAEGDIWDIWQVWFTWDQDEDGYPEDYVAHVHVGSKTLLRFRPNPYLNGLRPFVASQFVEVEGSFDGIGVCEMIEDYQEEISTIHNQRRDNAHIANTTMFAARRGSGITEKMRAYPGRVFMVGDPRADIAEIRMGQNYAIGIQEEQVTIAMAERRVGISDINLGRESSPLGRAAATTVMQLMQEGSRRHDLNTADLRRALNEQGSHIVEMFQAHGVPPPESPGSPEQVLDPEEAAAVRDLLERDEGVIGLMGVEINVATQAVNKEVERQNNMALFDLIVQRYYQPILQILPLVGNPQTPPPIRAIVAKMVEGADKLLDRVLTSSQFLDHDQLLLGDDLQQLVGALAAAGPPPMMPGPPGAMPGGPGPAAPPPGAPRG